MQHGITSVGQSFVASQRALATGGPPPTTANFKDLLVDSVNQVSAMQQDANQAVDDLLTGGDANPAEVLTAVQKADLAFRMTMQIRNKLMQAYEEVKAIRV